MESKQIRNFQFAKRINDDPSDEDGFSGHGHTRTAQALKQELLQLSNEDGAIGLEGDWGSGKSTVIRLAEDLISKDSSHDHEFLFFEFDLWIHQTDDFKRAFLISFLGWLNDRSIIVLPSKNFSLLTGKSTISSTINAPISRNTLRKFRRQVQTE